MRKYRWACMRCTATCTAKPEECIVCGGTEFEERTDDE